MGSGEGADSAFGRRGGVQGEGGAVGFDCRGGGCEYKVSEYLGGGVFDGLELELAGVFGMWC